MWILTTLFVTHVRIIASTKSTGASALRFGPSYCALLPSALRPVREFGIAFTPDHFRRGVSRVVSCYALFKWWLPLSQHPTCPRDFTALVTQRNFGALFGGPGLFPFRQRSLAPAVSLPGMQSTRSSEFGTPAGALDRSVLYTRVKYCPTLPLKAFRREPAITQLDKSFAPILSSSKTFSTVTRSRLHLLLRGLHAVQG